MKMLTVSGPPSAGKTSVVLQLVKNLPDLRIGVVKFDWFAIGVKLVCLVLGAAGVAGMSLAIFADVGVMVLAVLNAIRTLFTKELHS